MAVHSIGDDILLGVALPFNKFPAFATEHLKRYPSTRDVERVGRELREGNFPESAVPNFVKAVCGWGGYAGIGGRILKRNTPTELRNTLVEANESLASSSHDLERALTTLNRLHSLGEPSFASKHLRFLRPDLCPVFDSVLRDALPYSFDPEGYANFAFDCRAIAELLQQRGIQNPLQDRSGMWYVADVEACLFVHFNNWM